MEEQAVNADSNTKALASSNKLRDYGQFVKFRLSFSVLISAGAGFLIAPIAHPDWTKFLWLLLGGFLVTAASNGFNQVIEIETDKLMKRTASRPLPSARMSVTEALTIALIMGSAGVFTLLYFVNPLCGILSGCSLLSYALVYTPLKKISPFAVFVGAFPGAIPPLLGWVAATGELSLGAWVLFFLQFIWQFPHFWAIAWVLHDDYTSAGFRMLPSAGGQNNTSAFQTLMYAGSLIPLGLLPYFFGMAGIYSAIFITVCSIVFTLQALQLYRTLDDKSAKRLMFGSFIYLPLVQIALIFDKIIK
jgi:protoheme IX farnesyltransferase